MIRVRRWNTTGSVWKPELTIIFMVAFEVSHGWLETLIDGIPLPASKALQTVY